MKRTDILHTSDAERRVLYASPDVNGAWSPVRVVEFDRLWATTMSGGNTGRLWVPRPGTGMRDHRETGNRVGLLVVTGDFQRQQHTGEMPELVSMLTRLETPSLVFSAQAAGQQLLEWARVQLHPNGLKLAVSDSRKWTGTWTAWTVENAERLAEEAKRAELWQDEQDAAVGRWRRVEQALRLRSSVLEPVAADLERRTSIRHKDGMVSLDADAVDTVRLTVGELEHLLGIGG